MEQVEIAMSIPVQIPYVAVVQDAIRSAHLWEEKSRSIQDSDNHPTYDTLKSLLSVGRDIPVKLELLAQLESRHAAAKAWIDRTARAFFKKNTGQGLMEVIFLGGGGGVGVWRICKVGRLLDCTVICCGINSSPKCTWLIILSGRVLKFIICANCFSVA